MFLENITKKSPIKRLIMIILFKNALNKAWMFPRLSFALYSEKYLTKTVCKIEVGRLATVKNETMEFNIPYSIWCSFLTMNSQNTRLKKLHSSDAKNITLPCLITASLKNSFKIYQNSFIWSLRINLKNLTVSTVGLI